MAASPQYTAVPRLVTVQLNTANSATDGTGTLGAEKFTAGVNGSRLDRAVVKATVTTTAGMVRLFSTVNGARRLLTEIPVLAVTRSASVPGFETVVDFLGGLPIPAGSEISASTERGESIVLSLFGGDF
ncbi:hypothetical protein NJC38_07425 [Pseudomonas sp. 21LCFQ010]|uniref:hypothetical protein n=1 Tax=Pseudomonas sp. 21LCFQ010 TaxID=2957506 RepID=UPI002097C156|nr:hypothetical protein [Pseudomonas sp. 21LCFQ010]MCO8161987.1 hypothetical protein [Pseudomonas sp. 21LCFQ010]